MFIHLLSDRLIQKKDLIRHRLHILVQDVISTNYRRQPNYQMK